MPSLVDIHNKRDQIIKKLTPGYAECSRCGKAVPSQVIVHVTKDTVMGKVNYFICPRCDMDEDMKSGIMSQEVTQRM